MKYKPAKATPSYEEMKAYERGYNMATPDFNPAVLNFYPDEPVLQNAFLDGWHAKNIGAFRNELMAHV